MRINVLKTLILASLVTLAGCAADPAPYGKVYNLQGMEISKVSHEMADELYHHLYVRKALEQGHLLDLKRGRDIDDLVLPDVAITSFVDTDTYENAGHLGRVLAEMFTHELSSRGIGVFEYKLTGSMQVTQDGEYIYSRDYRQILQEASISNVLSGTISRNEQGVVLVARIVDVENHIVQSTATGFIPYDLLPYCYRTKEKQCSLGDIEAYLTPSEVDEKASRAKVQQEIREGKYQDFTTTSTAVAPKNQNLTGSDIQKSDVVRPVASRGNVNSDNVHEEDPMIHEAGSYLQGNRLSRDVVDQSQYLRMDDINLL